MGDKIIMGICLTLFIFFIAALPVFSQFKSGVNNGAFSCKKIKKFRFLFRAPDGIPVSEGLAIPLYIMQIIGYLLSLLTLITDILLLCLLQNSLEIAFIVTLSILGLEILYVVITQLILIKISHQ